MKAGSAWHKSYGPGTNFAAEGARGAWTRNTGLRQIGELAILLASAGTTGTSSLRQTRQSLPVPQHSSHWSETPIAAP